MLTVIIWLLVDFHLFMDEGCTEILTVILLYYVNAFPTGHCQSGFSVST